LQQQLPIVLIAYNNYFLYYLKVNVCSSASASASASVWQLCQCFDSWLTLSHALSQISGSPLMKMFRVALCRVRVVYKTN